MNNLTFRKLVIILLVVVTILTIFVLIESGVVKSNLKKAKTDSTGIKTTR